MRHLKRVEILRAYQPLRGIGVALVFVLCYQVNESQATITSCGGIDCGNDCCDSVTQCCDNGTCVPSTCNDGNPCTDDLCFIGDCQHTNNTATCDDDDPCTVNDTCSNGACAGTQKDCDDNNPCTTDTCDANGVCLHAPCPTDQCCHNGECKLKCPDCDDGPESGWFAPAVTLSVPPCLHHETWTEPITIYEDNCGNKFTVTCTNGEYIYSPGGGQCKWKCGVNYKKYKKIMGPCGDRLSATFHRTVDMGSIGPIQYGCDRGTCSGVYDWQDSFWYYCVSGPPGPPSCCAGANNPEDDPANTCSPPGGGNCNDAECPNDPCPVCP